MQHPMPLPVAKAALEQAMRDFQEAYEHAMAQDQAALSLAISMALTNIRDAQRRGMTDGGRKSLHTAAEVCKSALGME